jgi:hypothetical protein
MTIEEFLVELEKVKNCFDWKKYDQWKLIRGAPKGKSSPHFCPIAAVVYTKDPDRLRDVFAESSYLNISFGDTCRIINAADGCGIENILRKRILEILDLDKPRAQRA